MTQEQLAESASVDRSYLGKIEVGDVLEPGVDTLRRIAKALSVSLRQIAEPLGWYEDEQKDEGSFDTWEQVEKAIMDADNLDDAQKNGLILVLKPAVTAMLAEGAGKYERRKKGRAAS